jgi:tetratricopeptide (TPR) repeat protein
MALHPSRNTTVTLAAVLLGLAGCASGGGGGSPSGGADLQGALADARDVERGENPRNTDNTRAAEDHLDAAQDADDPAEKRTHYQAALTSAQAAIAEDARNPLGYRLAALANLGLGDFEAAGEAFDQSEELRPLYEFENVGVREQAYIDEYQAATPFLNSGDYDQAAMHLENASAVYHGRPEADITLAQIYASQRDHEKALAKIDEVESFLSSDSVADLDEEMVANWRSQTENFPLMRAQVLADAGRFEEAVTAYRELVAQNPDDVALQQDLGAILMQMGETEQALEVYTGLANRPGLNSDDLSRIGLGFYQAEQYGPAARALQRAVEVSPRDRDAIEWWARALYADSAWTELPPVVQRWIELDPQSQQALAILAQATNSSGNTDVAAQTVQRIQALEFSVNNLQMRRGMSGADVSGAVSNRSLPQGSTVTLVFTFYGEDGAQLGTVNQTVTLGAEGMSQVFQLQFDTEQYVGGYGYTVGG